MKIVDTVQSQIPDHTVTDGRDLHTRNSFLGAFAKLQKKNNKTIGFVMSVRPHGTTQLLLDGFV